MGSTSLNVFSLKDNVQISGGGFWGESVRKSFNANVKNLDATKYASGHSELWENTQTWLNVVDPKLKK